MTRKYWPWAGTTTWKTCLSSLFIARCIAARATSPLRTGEEVQVVGMASGDECEHEMLVEVRWGRRTLAVPLVQLESIANDTETQQAIEDWHYWIEQGYEF